MLNLLDRVALVTGASRGVGKGIALALGESGATVYITGRTRELAEARDNLPGTIYQTAEEISSHGGKGIALFCDHRNDENVETIFHRINAEQGRLDILVNNVWGGYENTLENGVYTWERPFWEQPTGRWDAMFRSGVRAHYVASQFAAPLMVAQRNGLIVNISSDAGKHYLFNTAYGVAKMATDRLAVDMAHELRSYNVAAVSLYPDLVRTESVLQNGIDVSNAQSPLFVGRVVAMLAADPHLMNKSGQVLKIDALANEYKVAENKD